MTHRETKTGPLCWAAALTLRQQPATARCGSFRTRWTSSQPPLWCWSIAPPGTRRSPARPEPQREPNRTCSLTISLVTSGNNDQWKYFNLFIGPLFVIGNVLLLSDLYSRPVAGTTMRNDSQKPGILNELPLFQFSNLAILPALYGDILNKEASITSGNQKRKGVKLNRIQCHVWDSEFFGKYHVIFFG